MSRLGNILTQDEKIGLSLAMLEDVIEVVRGVGGIEPVVIVTRDDRAGEIAKRYGIEVIREPEEIRGEGPAVDYGAGILEGRGIERLLVLPSDMPEVAAEDIKSILAIDAGEPSVVMAPAHDGGTNGMLEEAADGDTVQVRARQPYVAFAGGKGPGSGNENHQTGIVQGGRGHA